MDYEDVYKYPLNDSSVQLGGSTTMTKATKRRFDMPSTIGLSPLDLSSGEFDTRIIQTDFKMRSKMNGGDETPLIRPNLDKIKESGSPVSII
jgi:hypothetical protein